MNSWSRPRALQTYRPRRTRLTLERLEDRVTPSGFVVTDTGDAASDTGSLRHALVRANADTRANDVFTITFAPSVAGQTIALGSTLELSNTTPDLVIVIDGSAAPGVTIAGGGAGSGFSVFTVDAQVTADFNALTIAQGNTTGNGGGILDRQGTVTIDNCVLTGNAAAGGGAIANLRGTISITNSTLTGNSATVLGGAIENNLGTVTVQSCTLAGNTAGSDGGAIFNVGTLNVIDTTVSGNSASIDGGAIENFVGNLAIVNATFNGNTSSGDGGAIGNEGTLTMQCATVGGNAASGNGGGIENAGTLALENSIVAANTAAGLGDDIDGGVTTDLGCNLLGTNVESGGAAGDVFADVPGLAPLGYYGGAMKTMALLPGSPARDAGNAAAVGLPATDENGGPRTVNGMLDIGAYQTQADPLLVTTASDTDGLAGQRTLREAIALANLYAGVGAAANIAFAPALAGATVSLTQGVLELSGAAPKGTAAISIDGQPQTTLSGNGASGVLQIDSGVTAAVSALTIAGGSAASGGGILNNGTLTVSNCTFSGNATSGGDGGAIGNAGALTVIGSTFKDNTASGNGGAIAGSGTCTVTNCTFNGNTASGNGGGIEAAGSLSVVSCGLYGNTAGGNGGGIASSGTGSVLSSTLGQNTATGSGGGTENDGTLTIQDSTLGADAATEGGGINNIGTLTVKSSTISGNSAGDQGGGLTNSGTVTLQNTILSGNSAANGSPDLNGSIATDHGANLLGTAVYSGPAPPTDVVTDTPGVAPLGNYGGVLQTMPLLPNSKARNAGNARAAGLPSADEVGAPRTTNGRLDIGAYQMHANALLVTTPADPGGIAGQVALREAVALANAYAAGGNPATITFAPGLQGDTITLTQGPLELSGSTPKGPTISIIGGPALTLSGNGTSGVLVVDGGVSAVVAGLMITGGNAVSGGGIANNGTLTIANCTLAANTASGDGGAIDSAGALTVSNCTLTGNTASGNGGAIASTGVLAIRSTTLSANTASSGGGIASNFKLTLQNSILSANTATVAGPDLSGVITSDLGNNLLGTAVYLGPAPRSDILTDTPGVAPLADFGGPLPTMALLPTSRALGAGNPAVQGRPATDERGLARVTAGRLDTGAFQTQLNPFVVTTASDPGVTFGRLALREAVNLADAYAAAGRPATITFAAGLRSVALTQGTLHLRGATVAIDGGRTIAVSGGGASTVFAIDAGASAVLTGLTITGGNATSGGGIANDGLLTVQNCTLAGNSASGNGGAIDNAGMLTVQNCTLTGNSASGNGGAIASTGALTVQSCTISGNIAGAGGGIATTGWLTLQNSIVAANSATGAFPDILGTTSFDGGNNLLGAALAAATAPSTDEFTNTPGLAALGNYGGGLPTMALLPGSAALGAGSADGAPASDERGATRRRDSHGMPVVDIGAFESAGFAISVSGGNWQSAHVEQPFVQPLTVLITPRNPLEPVDGGVVWFTAQTGSKGQSARLSASAVIIAGRRATTTASANGTVGTYTIAASTGTSVVVFQLRNV